MAGPTDAATTHVEDVAKSALLTPFDPRIALPVDLDAPWAPGTLTLQVEDQTFELVPTQAEIRRIVGACYLIGGFDLVRSVHTAVRNELSRAKTTAGDSRDSARYFDELIRSGRNPGTRSVYERSLAQASKDLEAANARANLASKLEVLVARSWHRIAVAEERVLREYEPYLNREFAALADEAGRIANKEWDLYGPYDPDDDDGTTLKMDEARDRGTSKLKLRRGDELAKKIRDLGKSWKNYLDALENTRKLVSLGRHNLAAFGSGTSPEERVKNSRLNSQAAFESFDEVRTKIGDAFPAALQVYGKFGQISTAVDFEKMTNTNDAGWKAEADQQIGIWVMDALINAVDSSKELASQAFLHSAFKPGARMRVEPGDEPPSGLSRGQRRILDEGLTLPASIMIANSINGLDSDAQSAWLQNPVKNRLAKNGKEPGKDHDFLAPYAEGGRLHYAALEDVYRAVKQVKQEATAELNHALLIMDAIAAPLALFTGGESLVIAGVIHAVVRSREMYMSVSDYQARDELAQIALRPVQDAAWGHPSAVTLIGNLIEGGWDIATDLVNEGVAGAILGGIQISLIVCHGAEAVNEWAQGGALGSEAP